MRQPWQKKNIKKIAGFQEILFYQRGQYFNLGEHLFSQ